MVVDATQITVLRAEDAIVRFVDENQVAVLNVASPRLSGWPQAYAFVVGTVGELIAHFRPIT